MGTWKRPDPQSQESALSFYGGIYAGMLSQFAQQLGCEPSDVAEAARSDEVRLMTHIENESPERHHMSLTAENMQALQEQIEALQ